MLGVGGDLQMLFSHSITTGWVVGTLKPICCNKKNWTVFCSRWGQKHLPRGPLPSRLSHLVKLALIFISFDDKTQSRFLSVCNRSRSKTSSSSIDLMKSIICNRYWKLIYYWREFLFIDGNTATLFLRGTFHVTSESYDNKLIKARGQRQRKLFQL